MTLVLNALFGLWWNLDFLIRSSSYHIKKMKDCQLISKGLLKFSFAPKNGQKYFCISALAYKKGSNQKCSVREWYKVHLFFLFDLFLEARAEIQKYFRSFFGANEKRVHSKLTYL